MPCEEERMIGFLVLVWGNRGCKPQESTRALAPLDPCRARLWRSTCCRAHAQISAHAIRKSSISCNSPCCPISCTGGNISSNRERWRHRAHSRRRQHVAEGAAHAEGNRVRTALPNAGTRLSAASFSCVPLLLQKHRRGRGCSQLSV